MDNHDSERGKRAHIDRDGTVHGSGAGAGGGNPGEDYDDDPVGGGGVLPTGDEKTSATDGHKRDKGPGGSA
jgi:hypothetical protein